MEAAMFGTILLAVDNSEHAKHATALTAKLASATGDRVVVVHLIERVVTRGGRFDIETREEADALVEEHMEVLRGLGVPCEPLVDTVLTGLVPQVLAQVAKSLSAGVIVVGSRGLDDLASVLLGAVTQKLLHLSDRPVLVSRESEAVTAKVTEPSLPK
jgi:nucleotide-binding universal stress UspA family protein